MTLIFIYCVGCVLVGVLANNVGRNFGCWCFGAILFSPILIGLLLLVVHVVQPNPKLAVIPACQCSRATALKHSSRKNS